MENNIPQKGDVIFVVFNEQSGHEQKGWRPALVISNDLFNRMTGLVIVCPITNTYKKYPFHLSVPENDSGITGFIMVDQIRSIDFTSRKMKFVGHLPVSAADDAVSLLGEILK